MIGQGTHSVSVAHGDNSMHRQMCISQAPDLLRVTLLSMSPAPSSLRLLMDHSIIGGEDGACNGIPMIQRAVPGLVYTLARRSVEPTVDAVGRLGSVETSARIPASQSTARRLSMACCKSHAAFGVHHFQESSVLLLYPICILQLVTLC